MRIMMEGPCHFGEKCVYKHDRLFNSQDEFQDKFIEDFNKLKKKQVIDVKRTIKILTSNKYEEKSIKKSMKDIIAEIKILGCFK